LVSIFWKRWEFAALGTARPFRNDVNGQQAVVSHTTGPSSPTRLLHTSGKYFGKNWKISFPILLWKIQRTLFPRKEAKLLRLLALYCVGYADTMIST